MTIRTCIIGDDIVRSFEENVPSAVVANWLWASQDIYEKPIGKLPVKLRQ